MARRVAARRLPMGPPQLPRHTILCCAIVVLGGGGGDDLLEQPCPISVAKNKLSIRFMNFEFLHVNCQSVKFSVRRIARAIAGGHCTR